MKQFLEINDGGVITLINIAAIWKITPVSFKDNLEQIYASLSVAQAYYYVKDLKYKLLYKPFYEHTYWIEAALYIKNELLPHVIKRFLESGKYPHGEQPDYFPKAKIECSLFLTALIKTLVCEPGSRFYSLANKLWPALSWHMSLLLIPEIEKYSIEANKFIEDRITTYQNEEWIKLINSSLGAGSYMPRYFSLFFYSHPLDITPLPEIPFDGRGLSIIIELIRDMAELISVCSKLLQTFIDEYKSDYSPIHSYDNLLAKLQHLKY